MLKSIRYKGAFPAIDGHGRTRWLEIFVDVRKTGSHGAEVEGLRILKTRDGEYVNRLEQGKYQIAVTGEILTSNDPLAT
jgi:hypothetical protein